jgi:hypothetical protein
MSADNTGTDIHDEEGRPIPRKVDFRTKMEQLNDSLNKKKLRFYMLSEEVFDVNQEVLSKNDELKEFKNKYNKNSESFVDSMTEMALKEADLRYRQENVQESAVLVTNLATESNIDVDRYRAELKYALHKYQESRRMAKKLQNDFSKLSDTSRIQSLNFLAFCRYSHSAQMNEINKLSVSEELPSKKEITTCKREFEKCAAKSRKDLAHFYKAKIHEFQRDEKLQIVKCRRAMERNQAMLDGIMGFDGAAYPDGTALSNSVDHHLQVNSFESRVAQKLVADAQALLRGNSGGRRGSFNEQDDPPEKAGKGQYGAETASTKGAALFPQLMLDSDVPGSAGETFKSTTPSRSAKLVANAGSTKYNAPAQLPSYAQPRRAETPGSTPIKPTPPPSGTPSQKAVPPQVRAQLSELYHSKKKAAIALNDLHAPRTKAVFDPRPFCAVPGPESPLLQDCLLDSEITDKTTSANLVRAETGEFVDQGQALGNLMAQLCAAEGKFRQLNAIKEGLDIQLVKQAHFMMLIGRDLQVDIGKRRKVMLHAFLGKGLKLTGYLRACAESKTKKSGEHLSYPAQLSSASAPKVSSNELSNAFAPPGSSTSRSVGKMTAGGAIGNKYRFRIDPSATTAAPFVPLTEVRQPRLF